ncbi:MAG TPA: membrane dipeptidase [Bryobacteraceae bacterium]|nr:membrane dipeptidase [Bryobacteraceae bacterium]
MQRRSLLSGSLSLLAAPMLNVGRCRLFAGETSRAYSVRAIDLIANSNVIDMLGLPTLDWSLLDRWESDPAAFDEAEFHKLRSSGISVFHPAVAFDGECTYDLTREWFTKWNNLISRHPNYFLRVDGPKDLPRARQERKIGIILGMQDANHVRSGEDIDAFHGMGQRLTQITYNSLNRLGAGCHVAHDGGLRAYGHQIVRRMNESRMAIDISHCGERTSLEVIESSRKPVLITHSNCRALAPPVSRCKSDEVIAAAARTGGVIGLTSIRHFVRATNPVTIEDVLDHFDHAVKLAGVEHVGVGSDTDLNGRDSAGAPLLYDVAGLNHPQRMYDLTEGLIRRGYTDRHIEAMLGGNFERALSAIWSA